MWRLSVAAGTQTPAACSCLCWNGRPGNCIVLPGMQSTLMSTLYGSFSATNFTAFAGTWETSSTALSKPQSSFVFLLHSDLPATFSEKKHIQPKSYLSVAVLQTKTTFPSLCTVKACHSFLLQQPVISLSAVSLTNTDVSGEEKLIIRHILMETLKPGRFILLLKNIQTLFT